MDSDDYFIHNTNSEGYITRIHYGKHSSEATDKTIGKLPEGTTFLSEKEQIKIACILLSPESHDEDTQHDWRAKVKANFVYEQCEHCDKIRNKKKLI